MERSRRYISNTTIVVVGTLLVLENIHSEYRLRGGRLSWVVPPWHLSVVHTRRFDTRQREQLHVLLGPLATCISYAAAGHGNYL